MERRQQIRDGETEEKDDEAGEKKVGGKQSKGLTACGVRQTQSERGKLCYFSEDPSEVAHTKASGTTSLQPD